MAEGDAVEVEYDEKAKVATFSAPVSIVERTAGMLKRPGQPVVGDDDLDAAIRAAAEDAATERDERSRRA